MQGNGLINGEYVSGNIKMAHNYIAIKFLNQRTLVANNKGEVLSPDTIFAEGGAVPMLPVEYEFDSIAIAEKNTPPESEGWGAIGGVIEILLKDGTGANRGDWLRASDVPGRAIAEASPTSIGAIASNTHFKEVGHCLDTVAPGTNVRVRSVFQTL